MNADLILLLLIVGTALVLFIGGWARADLVGLLVLSALALTGLVTPGEALAGFSSPAVVTVWAMFIISAGLMHTGVAHRLGRPLQRFAHGGDIMLIVALMGAASLLSALINTVTVAAILLPATMELARRSGRPPSRLLMPLSMGCLLGGPFTGISTPPNILATDALRNAGLSPFALLDFTPITAVIVLVGIVFVVLCGRHMLPNRAGVDTNGNAHDVGAPYQLDAHIFTIPIPEKSPLAGCTLSESRLGSALYVTVVAIQRHDQLTLFPRPSEPLRGGDTLVVHGHPDLLHRFRGSQHLRVEHSTDAIRSLNQRMILAEGCIDDGAALLGRSLEESRLRMDCRVQVLRVFNAAGCEVDDPRRRPFEPGDRLLILGEPEAVKALDARGFFTRIQRLKGGELRDRAPTGLKMVALRVPQGSILTGHDLVESRLGNAFGLTVVAIERGDALLCMPAPDETILADDLLILQGKPRDLNVLAGLQELTIAERNPRLTAELESQQVGVAEVLLSPRTNLAGKTLAELLFRDHYGVSVLAIWRKGAAFRKELQNMPLMFGDALLVYGPRRGLEAIARDPDFLVLDQAATQVPRLEKATWATLIALATILSAIFGLLPIAIAAVVGATLMVLVGCLNMEEAYRAIDWKVIFLIACMLPLGVAVEHTGAAQMGAEALIGLIGGLGPRWVVASLFFVTVLGTQIIPTAALVVLMAPVALTTADALVMSPQLLMMTVAMAASSSFASPLSHPAHLLVMGPGGYRFMDYVKLGVPLTILSFLACVGLLPIFWPP